MENCSICGAVIGENNHTGIGGGCMSNVVFPAKKDCFFEIKGLALWQAKVEHVRSVFIEQYKSVKFRSAFRKSFYESMSTAERVSKKQMEIMQEWLSLERIYFDLHRDVYWSMLEKFDPQRECPDLYSERISIHKKLYLSGKKDRQEQPA